MAWEWGRERLEEPCGACGGCTSHGRTLGRNLGVSMAMLVEGMNFRVVLPSKEHVLS